MLEVDEAAATTDIDCGICQCGCGQRAPIAKTTDRTKGWIKGQPLRFIRGHYRPPIRHGLRHTPEYYAWNNMLERCRNPRNRKWPTYGGRGIAVCARWFTFENFLADVGPRPSRAHSIDRKDNDGHYEPGNCRWATSREQNQNLRTNRRIEYAGETLCVSAWARRRGISKSTLTHRVNAGWPLSMALGQSADPRRPAILKGS